MPTGYSFNLDGTNIYMTMAVLFIAQATNIELTWMQQLTLLAVAMLTSKGASGVTGAGFITLAATLAVVPTIPLSGMVLILGIDRFMSECRALTNIVGNGVATVVVSAWEKARPQQAAPGAEGRRQWRRPRRPASDVMKEQAAPPAGGASRGGRGGRAEAYDTIGDPHRQEASTVTRRLLILVVLAAALAAACTLTWTITWRRGVAELQRNAAVRVDRTTNALKSTLDRYESLPYLLGSHPYVQDLLAEPTRADYTGRVNRYLEDLNEHAHATVTYVIGADGLRRRQQLARARQLRRDRIPLPPVFPRCDER